MGDHMIIGEGLVPEGGKKEELVVNSNQTESLCFLIHCEDVNKNTCNI